MPELPVSRFPTQAPRVGHGVGMREAKRRRPSRVDWLSLDPAASLLADPPRRGPQLFLPCGQAEQRRSRQLDPLCPSPRPPRLSMGAVSAGCPLSGTSWALGWENPLGWWRRSWETAARFLLRLCGGASRAAGAIQQLNPEPGSQSSGLCWAKTPPGLQAAGPGGLLCFSPCLPVVVGLHGISSPPGAGSVDTGRPQVPMGPWT